MAKQSIRLTVNHRAYSVVVDCRRSLLDCLREDLKLSGTKKGCDHGQCGACTAIVNAKRIYTCLTLAVAQNGAEVITVEGLAQGEELSPLQEAFLRHDACRCGFCTAGQLCAATALLEELRAGEPSIVSPSLDPALKPVLDFDEVRERMSGNLCRCGAYPNIVAAILEAWSDVSVAAGEQV